MNARPVLLSQLARNLLSSKRIVGLNSNNVVAVRNSSAYKPPANWKPQHYDELPLPQGSWQQANDMKQKRYNLHLLVGTSFFLLTVFYIKASGVIFFNFSPPPLPEE